MKSKNDSDRGDRSFFLAMGKMLLRFTDLYVVFWQCLAWYHELKKNSAFNLKIKAIFLIFLFQIVISTSKFLMPNSKMYVKLFQSSDLFVFSTLFQSFNLISYYVILEFVEKFKAKIQIRLTYAKKLLMVPLIVTKSMPSNKDILKRIYFGFDPNF